MRSEKLIDQLELYSNAIVGFIVAQSLVFSFNFGSSVSFSCVVIEEKALAAGLIIHFVFSTGLAVIAIQFLSRNIRRLSQENQDLVQTLFMAKSGVVVLFAVIPVVLLVAFGVLELADAGRCKSSTKNAGVNSLIAQVVGAA